jgi:hypothetical protein
MAKSVRTITFDPRPLKVGHDWHVVATHPGGEGEHITRFKTEDDAKDWIANESEAWLKKRGYGGEV